MPAPFDPPRPVTGFKPPPLGPSIFDKVALDHKPPPRFSEPPSESAAAPCPPQSSVSPTPITRHKSAMSFDWTRPTTSRK
ncbi:hypothetical protein CCP2SC5_130014 [Azospirillaceae bacterium]